MSDILTVLQPIVTLSFPNTVDRQSSFPLDPKHDIIISQGNNHKKYLLQRNVVLRQKSLLLQDLDRNTTDIVNIQISPRIDPEVLQNILGCFYGIPIEVNEHEQFYELYESLEYLGVEDLVIQLQVFLIHSDNLTDIVVGTQICLIYNVEMLCDHYFNFYDREHRSFHMLFDVANLRPQISQARLFLSQYQTNKKNPPPLNILLYDEMALKQIIRLHNQLKRKSITNDKFLSYESIYEILKLYCYVRNRSQDQNQLNEDQRLKLKELVFIIDKNELSQDQYKSIYLGQNYELGNLNSFKNYSEKLIMNTTVTQVLYSEDAGLMNKNRNYDDFEENDCVMEEIQKLSLMMSQENSRFSLSLMKIQNLDNQIQKHLDQLDKLNTKTIHTGVLKPKKIQQIFQTDKEDYKWLGDISNLSENTDGVSQRISFDNQNSLLSESSVNFFRQQAKISIFKKLKLEYILKGSHFQFSGQILTQVLHNKKNILMVFKTNYQQICGIFLHKLIQSQQYTKEFNQRFYQDEQCILVNFTRGNAIKIKHNNHRVCLGQNGCINVDNKLIIEDQCDVNESISLYDDDVANESIFANSILTGSRRFLVSDLELYQVYVDEQISL